MDIQNLKTIGEIVAEDYRTAEVFKSLDIDFCCNGNKTIDEVCLTKDINKQELLTTLFKIRNGENTNTHNYNDWPLDLLVTYIEKVHHRFVEEKSTVLKQYLNKICIVHGQKHPELFQINELFLKSSGELSIHMKKEELIIFPYIRKMVRAQHDKTKYSPAFYNSINEPLRMMQEDHENEGDRFRNISELSNNHTAPWDACNTYKLTYRLLKEFETDLHLHIHLENNILFPKATELEKKLKS